MHPFASYVLRNYYLTTGWNEDNLYANITRSSHAILDFAVPKGLHFSVSKAPNTLFRTTYSMNAIPSLNGSVGYVFSSRELNLKSSKDVRFKDMVERFKIYDQPRRPEGREEEWLSGQRVDTRDYLMYGRLYLPTGRLDALYSIRVSPTVQALAAAISDPHEDPRTHPKGHGDTPTNLMLTLQHDVGRWCTEYTWSAEDSMWGVRVLHNFGKLASSMDPSEEADRTSFASPGTAPRLKRVDEEEALEAGLRGRISVGAEFYVSAKERSAGVSTGIRFTTLPDATPPSHQLSPQPSSSSSPPSSAARGPPSQTPTTITALFNPVIGHISTAYAARVSRDLSLASRFDFNVYSYESEWTMGAEWWMRRAVRPLVGGPAEQLAHHPPLSLSPLPSFSDDVLGVVKARASTSNDVSLMWEGRLRNMLVSLGVVSNFSSRLKPIKAIGLELSYFSSE